MGPSHNDPICSHGTATVTKDQVTFLAAQAVAQWLNLVDMPSGQGGIGFGFVQGSAIQFPIEAPANKEGLNSNGNTGFSESGFHDQSFFLGESSLTQIAWPNQMASGLGGGHPL